MANPLVEEAKAVLKKSAKAGAPSEARVAEQGIAGHPMFLDALETLALQKKLDPVKYNELLNKQADEIAKNIRQPLPGGAKGISYPIGTESSKVYYTTPQGKLEWRPRSLQNEIPEGSKIHNLSRDDIVRELGGLREAPATPASKAAPSPTSVEEALDITRKRRLAEEAAATSPEESIYAQAEASRAAEQARQAAAAPAPASSAPSAASAPTPGYGTASGPWGTAATSSPMPSLLNDQAYAAWLKGVNRRANDLTQAGAATGAGALYYRGLPKSEAAGDAGEPSGAGVTPRRDQPAPYTERPNYSPITDTARDVLRERVNTPILSPLSDDVSHDESRSSLTPALGPAPYMDEGRSAYDSVLGALPFNPGRGGARNAEAEAKERANLVASRALSSTPARDNSSPGYGNDLRSIPQPMRRLGASPPATDEGNQSFFSSLLNRLTPKDPYAGMSARQMYEKAQEMQGSGDEGGSNALIQRAGRAPDAGMKRGGVAGAGGAGPHKDAALHKALDIIHAMMMRGR